MSDPTAYHNQFTEHLNRHRRFYGNGYDWDGDEFLRHLRQHIENLARQETAEAGAGDAIRLPGVVVTPEGARSLDPRTGQADTTVVRGAGANQPLAAALAQTIGGTPRTPFEEEPSELLGQAQFWGVPDPESWTEVELAGEVERRRSLAPANPLSQNPTDPLAGMLAGTLFGVGHGVAESAGEIVDALRRVPGIPESFVDAADKWLGSEESRKWLGKLQENYRSRLSETGQAVFDANLGVGYVVGMAPMAVAVYKATGVGPLGKPAGSLAGVLARAGARGAGTTMILDAGEDMPWLPDAGDLENAGLRTPDARDALARAVLGNRAGRATFGAFVDAGIEGGLHLLRNSRATVAPKREPRQGLAPARDPLLEGQSPDGVPYADFEVVYDDVADMVDVRGPTSPFSPVQRRLGAGDPPAATVPDVAPNGPVGPLSGPEGGPVPPTPPGRVYHMGDYAGGVGNPQASITGSAGTYGQGLYFGKNRTALAEMVPGQQHGWAGQMREFDISSAKLARMDEPLTPELFERMMVEIGDEFSDDWRAWYAAKTAETGNLPTIGDWYWSGNEAGEEFFQDSANELLKAVGFDGVEDEQEVNIFPGREAEVVKVVTPEGTPVSPVRGVQGTTISHTFPDERSFLFRSEQAPQPRAEPSWWEQVIPEIPRQPIYGPHIEDELVPLRQELAEVQQRLVDLEAGTAPWITQEYVDVDDAREGTMRHINYILQVMDAKGRGHEVSPEAEQALIDHVFQRGDLSKFTEDQLFQARTELEAYDNARARAETLRTIGEPERARAIMENADQIFEQVRQQNPAVEAIRAFEDPLPALRKNAGLREATDTRPAEGLADIARRRNMYMRTPARALAHMSGTAIRDETGYPLLLHHGTPFVYEDFQVDAVGAGGLTGEGIYFASIATPSGRDPIDVAPELGYNQPGYAFTGAATRAAQKDLLLSKIASRRAQIQQAREAMEYNRSQGQPTATSEEMIRLMEAEIDKYQSELEAIPDMAPNMRPVYVMSNAILRADDPMDKQTRSHLIGTLVQMIETDFADKIRPEFRQRLVNMLRDGERQGVIQGPKLHQDPPMDDIWDLEAPIGLLKFIQDQKVFPPGTRRQLVLNAGWNVIHNHGGMRSAAGKLYDAYNVLDETLIVPAFAEESWVAERAKSLGVQLGKQAQVLQSEAFPDVTGKVEVEDSDVVRAALSRNPAGVSLVKGIADPALLLAHAVEGYLNWNGVAAKHWRMVEREGRIDLLVSTLTEITDETVDTYARYGVFPGQEVQNVNSGKVRVLASVFEDKGKVYASTYDPTKGMARQRSGKIGFHTVKELLSNIAPTYYAPQTLEAPELWTQFTQYAETKLATLHQELGVAVEDAPLFLTQHGRERLPRLFDEFADSQGLIDPATRVALRSYFDIQLIASYRDLLPPEETVMFDMTRQELEALQAGREPIEASVHRLAEARGFRVVPIPGSAEVSLEDTMSAEKFRMADEDAARSFLMEYSRDLHDADPGGPVPVELSDLDADGSVLDYPSDEDAVADAMAELDELMEDVEYEATQEAVAVASGAVPPPRVFYLPGPSGAGPSANRASSGGQAPPGGASPAAGRTGGTGGSPPRAGRASTRRGGGGPGGPPNLGNVAQHWGDVNRLLHSTQANYLWPIRTTFADLEQVLADAGAPNLRPWRDYETISRNLDVAHNEAYNYHRDLTSASGYIGSIHLRRGHSWRVFAERDPALRAQLAAQLKLSPRELQAVGEMEQVMTQLLGQNAGPALDELAQFVNSTMANQLRNAAKPYGDPQRFTHIRWFAEHARDVYADFRQPDLASILHAFVRGYHFNKHVGVSWQVAKSTWNAVRNWKDSDGKRPLEPLANFFLDWMDVVYRGHDKGRDFALSLVMGITKMVGVPLTRYEASRFINGGLNAMHRSFLGWRLAPLVRDSIQPLLAGPRVGAEYLSRAYTEVVKDLGDKAKVQAIFDRMADFGVLQRGIPPIEISAASEANAGAMMGPTRFTPQEEARRLFFQKVRDWTRDMVHPELRHISSTKLDPLWAYTNLGAWNRVVTGHAAWLKVSHEYAGWAAERGAAVAAGNLAGAPTPQQLLKRLNAHTFQPAIQRRLLEHIAAGDQTMVEKLYVNQVVDESQFRYGTREVAPALRTNSMKIGIQFGNFTTQFLANLRNGMKHGDLLYRTRWLAWFGGLTAVLGLAEEQTGWPFKRMGWAGAFGYRGGPALGVGRAVFDWTQGITDLMGGVEGSPEARAVQMGGTGTFVKEMAQAFNPTQGAIDTFAGVNAAQDAPNPLESAFEFLLTGDRRSTGTYYDRMWESPPDVGPPVTTQPPRYGEPQ